MYKIVFKHTSIFIYLSLYYRENIEIYFHDIITMVIKNFIHRAGIFSCDEVINLKYKGLNLVIFG